MPGLFPAAPGTSWSRAAVVASIALAAYAGSVHAGLVFDDVQAIVLNPVVKHETLLREAFTRDFWGRRGADTVGSWRPLPVLLFAGEWAFGGAFLLHAMNVVFHAAACVVVYFAMEGLAGGAAAFLVAVLLATVAAPSEAVQAVVGRADLLAALAVWGGLILHRRGSWGATAFSSVVLALGLISKESVVLAPLVWLAADALLPKRAQELSLGVKRLQIVCYVSVVLVWLVGRRLLFPEAWLANGPLENPLAFASPDGRLLGAGSIFLERTLGGLLWPWQRLAMCSAPACGPRPFTDLLAWVGVGLLALPVVLAVSLRRWSPLASFGFASWAVLFLPVSNALVAGPSVYSERALYVALPGLFLAVVAVCEPLVERSRAIGWALLVAWLVPNLLALQARHGDWKSAERLYSSVIQRAPDGALGHAGLASVLLEKGDVVLASTHARRAVELQPQYTTAWSLLATSLDRQGRATDARAAFEESLSGGPDPLLVADYARFLVRQGEVVAARTLVDHALDVRPRDPVLSAVFTQLQEQPPDQR